MNFQYTLRLSVRHFGVAYEDRVIHSEVNCELQEGRVHLLFGAAGSGKSTLLKALSGWHQRIPNMRVWGTVQVTGDPAATARAALLHQSLGLFVSSIGNNLSAALHDRSTLDLAAQRRAVTRALEPVGLDWFVGRWTEPVSTLSLLDLRLLNLALALIESQRIIFLDEPGANLSDKDRELLTHSIERISSDRILLIATHDSRDCERFREPSLFTLSERYDSTPAEAMVIDAPQAAGPRVAPLGIRRVAPSGFFWIRGRNLAAFSRPGLMNDLSEDLQLLKALGISKLVCLEETFEHREAAHGHGLATVHWPIADMQAPTDAIGCLGALRQLASDIADNGDRLGVQCRAGLGRTGLIVACLLMLLDKLSAHEALRAVRAINPRFVQSNVQLDFLGRFEALCGHS
jgi:energy-coupling factor transporter ATP-binding protein EcfA2/protein-tyrosine phosphatase